jgi:hypothetical protein
MTPRPRFTLALGSRVGIRGWSDIHPATVVSMSRTGRRVTVRQDTADLHPDWSPEIVPGGFAGHCSNQYTQQWVITDNPDGPLMEFSLRQDGQWWASGSKVGSTYRLIEGWRKFYDFNF